MAIAECKAQPSHSLDTRMALQASHPMHWDQNSNLWNARTSASYTARSSSNIRGGAIYNDNLPESAKARKQVRSALTATVASVDLIARWGKLWRLMHASKYLFNPKQSCFSARFLFESSVWSATQWLSKMSQCSESLRFPSFHVSHCVGPTDIPI